MELVSERCIVSLLDRVVEVKPKYIFLFSEIQSLKGHLNWFTMFVYWKTPIEGEELFFGGFKFIIIYNKFYFFY